MPDIIDTLNKREITIFYKDLDQVLRVTTGINKDYGRLDKNLDNYMKDYKKLINLFNKKYPNLNLKFKTTLEELKLDILFKTEKNVKDIFINAASKIIGLKSVGAKNIGTADVADPERFSNEVERIDDKVNISYYDENIGASTILLEFNKKQKKVEIHYNLDTVIEKTSPEFKLIAYYALKDGFKKKIDVFQEGAKFGFLDLLNQEEKKEWVDKFDPHMGE
jgi:hypothetical protein